MYRLNGVYMNLCGRYAPCHQISGSQQLAAQKVAAFVRICASASGGHHGLPSARLASVMIDCLPCMLAATALVVTAGFGWRGSTSRRSICFNEHV
jgi:hypothetical protein